MLEITKEERYFRKERKWGEKLDKVLEKTYKVLKKHKFITIITALAVISGIIDMVLIAQFLSLLQ